MDSYRILSLVDYIQLIQKGQLDKTLYSYFEPALKECTPFEVNIAIENLLIRYKHVEALEKPIARFIRAASLGLDQYPAPKYGQDGLFPILIQENRVVQSLLNGLKKSFMQILPELKENRISEKARIRSEIDNLASVKSHYLKLQYGLFSALESVDAPTQCIKLIWHLQDSVWIYHKDCLELLSGKEWDFNRFNRVYGQMYFLLGTLLYREEKILYPVAAEVLSGSIQTSLVEETESYGILS